MAKRTRKDLYELFKQGAIPSGADFADFIESMINSEEDGLEKLASNDQPLKITAQGTDENILDICNRDKVPTWRINQKSADKKRNGLNLSSHDISKFFIENTSGKLGINTDNPEATLSVNGTVNINNGNNYANKSNFMAPGSLTIGDTKSNYGGGKSWNKNTSGLLMEALDNTEIAVHDSGDRITSLMYYEGGKNKSKITIGRDMGWGAAKNISLQAGLTTAKGALQVEGSGEIRGKLIVANEIETGKDQNKTSIIGRSAIGFCGHNDWASFSHNRSNNPGGYALLQNAEGRTLLNAAKGQSISFRNGNADKMVLNPKGDLSITGGLTVSGPIAPSPGNGVQKGIMFPKNPFGGGGDAAWIRYYARSGEATTFEIGTSNDKNDHIALMPSGNVGIGTNDPKSKLHINGVVRAQAFEPTSMMMHRMYPENPIVYQNIFDAVTAKAIRKIGKPKYNATTHKTSLWNDRPIICYGNNNQADGNGAEINIPPGYNTIWVRVLGERWTVIKAYFTDGNKEKLGLWPGGHRSGNCYCPDGSLTDTHHDHHQWMPIPAGRSGKVALIAKPHTGSLFWLSGLAFSKNPWAHATQSAVGYHWATNGGTKIAWGDKWENWNGDSLTRIDKKTNPELMVPFVASGNDKLLYFIEHNNNWNGCMHNEIMVNGKKIERFFSTYDNPFARHWNSKYFNRYIAARIPAAALPKQSGFLKVKINMKKQNHGLHFREAGTHDLHIPDIK